MQFSSHFMIMCQKFVLFNNIIVADNVILSKNYSLIVFQNLLIIFHVDFFFFCFLVRELSFLSTNQSSLASAYFQKFILTLRKKCPYSELFWPPFSHIWNAFLRIRISPYSVQIQDNEDQNNSEYGHFHTVYICFFHNCLWNFFVRKRIMITPNRSLFTQYIFI